MKATKIIEELQEVITPYTFYWEQWMADENCNLAAREMALAGSLLESGFKISLSDPVRYYSQIASLKELSRKLQSGYPVFKEVVVFDFLTNVIKMAKAYGFDLFLQMPGSRLDIPAELKASLQATLQQLFLIYKAEDFSRGWVYKRVVDFHIIYQQSLFINQQKPMAMKTESS